MSALYHPRRGGKRGATLAVAVAATTAAVAADRLTGGAATALQIALITAVILTALGILGAGTYLVMRARRQLAPPPPEARTIRVTGVVIHPPAGSVPQDAPAAIQGKPLVFATPRPLGGAKGTAA